MKRWILAATAAAAFVTVGLGAAGRALAANPQLPNIDEYKPAVDPFGYSTVNGARTLDPFQAHVSGHMNWAKRPLDAIPGRDEVVKELTMFDLVGAVGLLKFGHGGIELGADLPIAVRDLGLRFDPDTGIREAHKSVLADLRTEAKITALDREDDIIGLAARAAFEWPTGSEEDFLSENGKTSFTGTAIIEKKLGKLRLGVEFGYKYIDGEVHVASATIDDKLLMGAGLAFEPVEHLSIFAEVHGYTRFEKPWDHEVESPYEVGAGVKWTGTLFLMLGIATKVNGGIDAPDERIFGSIGLTF